jgi:hypothetical protein
MNKTSFSKHILNYKSKIIFGFFFILLMASYVRIFAIGSPYQPGATLDPACTPGEVNCIVSYDLTFFKQNGNSFAGTATLGTNDSNVLVFETDGTEKMRVGTNGNVSVTGIAGQTSSVPQLSILGAASTAKSIALATYTGTTAAHFIGDDGGAFFGAGLAISASGTNSQLFLQPVSSGRNVNIGSSTALGSKLGVKGDASGNPVLKVFDSSSNPLLTVLSAGNVGIGTAAPANKLDINGSMGLASDALIGFAGAGTTLTASNYAFSGNASLTALNVATGGTLSLRINNAGIATFKSTGLEMLGNGLSSSIKLQNTGVITFASTIDYNSYALYGDTSNTSINTPTGGTISFRNNNIVKATMDSSGNFGIGATPSNGRLEVANSYTYSTGTNTANVLALTPTINTT